MSPKKILIAEDNESFLKLVLHTLGKQGYETKDCSRGDEVMAAFEEFSPDLVVLDGLLPGKDGFELAKEIRALKTGKDIPIVMLTGVYKEADFHKYSEEIGIDLHYDKSNFDGKEFALEIKRLLAE
ncbi:MAG: response regulator [Deltaproteobacteria bacterium]|uniref:Response regulator n=1 Tax=Candidatus Zymogenus saltonus TaxID=2844893 RepID=A0A9D8KFU5_9DELT|nr:response regulator [Candidatus Zymogenus saltonus]